MSKLSDYIDCEKRKIENNKFTNKRAASVFFDSQEEF